MIKSMTGFGKAEVSLKNKNVTIEIRSLNSKQMDINMRALDVYREKELALRSLLAENLIRGKIDLNITLEITNEKKDVNINRVLVKKYHKELKSLAKELSDESKNLLPLILSLPDIMKIEKEKINEKEWKQIMSGTEKAIGQLEQFRITEGKALEKDLQTRIDIIQKLLSEIEILDKERIPSVKERLKKNISDLLSQEKIDENRFEQELIYYIEKFDITEEKVRLKTHCEYFFKTMNENECGKKLGFISQEIGREINTIGSKANDADIQKIVVQMKDELEKIKEQLNNVL
ncbi:MAG: YicC/YloC family endoribonuclease [Bacteroidota bacterium]